jgi:hypothetical protein
MDKDVEDALAALNAKLDGLTPAQRDDVDDAADAIDDKVDAADDAGEEYDAKSAITALEAKIDGFIATNSKRTVPTRKPAPRAPAPKAPATGAPATADGGKPKRRRGWFPADS